MATEKLYQALAKSRGQKILEETFQLEIDLYRINNINLSSVVSYIIREVGRLCDSYASDAFYSLKTLFNDLEGDGSVLFEQDEYQWVIGIRDMGCDHDNFIESTLSQKWDLDKRYRAIYEIHIEPESKHWWKMTLSKIMPWCLEAEYKKLTEEAR